MVMSQSSSLIIPKKPDELHAPLSFAQRRLWFLYQLDPQSPEYNISRAWRLKGSLHTQVLEISLNLILARHEALRTTFQEIDGQPVQVIQPTLTVVLQERDWSTYSSAQLETEIDRVLTKEPLEPFDLYTGPLLRFTLLRCSRDDYVFVITVHHIVFDGTSLKNFCQELSQCYTATLAGQPSPLTPLPIQYQDYAYWQQAQGTEETLTPQVAFWKEHLHNAPLVLELPSDFSRPKRNSGPGAYQTFTLAPQILSDLKRLIQPQRVTLFMALLAVFQILLARYTGRGDILVGTPIAGRTHMDLEDLIGFLVNTLVLRTQITDQHTFAEVLRQVRKTCLGAYRHQGLPFEQLVEVLKPVRDPSRYPVVQAIFQLRHASDLRLSFPGLSAHPLPFKKRTGNFDLHMVCDETETGIQGFIYYPQDLYPDSMMAGFAKHYHTLLKALLAHPRQPVRQIPFLTDIERQQQLVDWNATAAAYSKEQSLPQLFEAQVAERPDVVAVVCGDEQVTYAQLNTRANQLAHYLRRHGVGPEVRVGVCLERGLDLIVSLLAILKAGGAYVPLDPSAPKERLAYLIADAGVGLVVTQDAHGEQVADTPVSVITFEALPAGFNHAPSTPLAEVGSSEQLAYIMYTSGSTGQPKGILISQRSVVRLVKGTNYLQVGPRDRVGHLANVAFDASTFEVWGSLLNGAAVVVFSQDEVLSPQACATQLHEQGITAMFLTTALFNQLARDLPTAFSSVETVLFGGELVDQQIVAAVWQAGPPSWLGHVYGPTESTTFATWHPVAACDLEAGTVPIGKPISNTQVYVLDHQQELVPVGVYGELSVGGDGLAWGYLKQPALTAERFVPHPWSAEPGARLYRTGDLVRYRREGAIEFQGRRDSQVKLRGYRIELEEIEAALREQSQVQETVVLCREDTPGDKQVVAYVTKAQETMDVSDLRGMLQGRLPGYMVPSAFVILEQLPLTPNGKVDKRALPVPEGADRTQDMTYVAPRTTLEELLAAIWQEVLGLEQVGIHDDFFALGGHSLLATQVVSRVWAQLRIEVKLATFFEGPTVAGLAGSIERARSKSRTPSLVPCSRERSLPLSYAQQRLWFLHQMEPDSAGYNSPLAVRLSGLLDLTALQQSLQALVERHESLRTAFAVVEGEATQAIATALTVSLHQEDLRGVPEAAREAAAQALVRTEVAQPFDLATGPVIRARLVQLTDNEHVFVLTLHHIVSDGWSLGVLCRELETCYNAFIEGEAPSLPALPIQYADYAVWQRAWLQGEVLEEQLGYWRRQLADLAPLALPTDQLRPPVQTYGAARQVIPLPTDLYQTLLTFSQQQGVTLSITMLAAFNVLLARYTGQSEIVVGSPIANRTRQEIEGLIGFFVNSLVLRTDVSGDPKFGELVARVKEVSLGAYDHQDLPFERIVEELQPERDPSRNPLFQVMFAVQNAKYEELRLPGLTIKPFQREGMTTRVDLECHVWERREALTVSLAYNTDLFEATTIEQFGRHYQCVLEEVVRDSGQRLSQIALLDEGERQQQLIDWNATAAAYPKEQSLPQLFEAQVAERPEAVAVVCGDEQVTYAQLNQRTNQLAHYLRRHGVGPEVRVGVCLERGVDLVVSLLAILKAGGAYVPLDPAAPTARLAYLLQDAAVGVVLTGTTAGQALPARAEPVVEFDDLATVLAQEPVTPVPIAVPSGTLAYIMYTSGSTGQPKGVQVAHRNVGNLVQWHQETFELSHNDRTTQLAGLAFDATVWEIWPTLLAGACLVFPDNEDLRLAPGLLRDWLIGEKITVSFLPTPLAENILTLPWPAQVPLRTMLTGGDILHRAPPAALPFTLVNNYGPTENTVVTTSAVVSAPSAGVGQAPPIGQPISNTQVYVQDSRQQLVPVGVAGELLIGGDGLAWGYLNQPGVTAEKFVPHPFSQAPGARVYRSGDQVRWRAEGMLEFLGRQDRQIKLRGYRIELEEIEAALQHHPEIREAVVVCREEPPGEKQLVAYVVPSAESVTSGELRTALQRRLPPYMVPAVFVLLPQLPLTPNGKVDLRALPQPDAGDRMPGVSYVAPRTDLERQLAHIWQEVLKLERVGIHDNFFELGGHSLLATQLIWRISEHFAIKLPIQQLFEQPTIAELSSTVKFVLDFNASHVEPSRSTDQDYLEVNL